MSELSNNQGKARGEQIRARYNRHYTEQGNFVIEARTPELVQIIVRPNEAAELLGDLVKYCFDTCKKI